MSFVCIFFTTFAHAKKKQTKFCYIYYKLYEFHFVNYRLVDGYYTGGGGLHHC